jgi:hypothetical protein
MKGREGVRENVLFLRDAIRSRERPMAGQGEAHPKQETPAHPAFAAELFEALQCTPLTLPQTGREQAVVPQSFPPVRVRARARRAIRVVPSEHTRRA